MNFMNSLHKKEKEGGACVEEKITKNQLCVAGSLALVFGVAFGWNLLHEKS